MCEVKLIQELMVLYSCCIGEFRIYKWVGIDSFLLGILKEVRERPQEEQTVILVSLAAQVTGGVLTCLET